MIFQPLHILGEIARLWDDHRVIAYMGCELEWYLRAPQDPDSIARVHAATGRDVKTESGTNQFETCWQETPDLLSLANAVVAFKARLSDAAKAADATVSFAAKPLAHEYGNALQLHIHLETATGKRLFEKQGNQLSPHLSHAIGGLLATLSHAMPIFAPSENARARLIPNQDAPTTISWGGNNRTVALRLPMKNGPLCHIEHRVPCADADIHACIAAILCGVHYGLTNQCSPGPQIFGNAADQQYELEKLLS